MPACLVNQPNQAKGAGQKQASTSFCEQKEAKKL
jgi:hypothetical protein